MIDVPRHDLVTSFVPGRLNFSVRSSVMTAMIDARAARNTALSTSTLPTLPYAAPEVIGAYRGAITAINEAMDVWSMAIVIVQAVLREPYGPMSEDVSKANANTC